MYDAISIIVRGRVSCRAGTRHQLTNYYQVCSSAQPSITTSARGERLQPRPGHSGSRLARAVLVCRIIFMQYYLASGLTEQTLHSE